jgi:hypothetical protein
MRQLRAAALQKTLQNMRGHLAATRSMLSEWALQWACMSEEKCRFQ